jgi:hypothetical protein
MLAVFTTYVVLGGAFACAYLLVGVDRLDSQAKGAGIGFRIAIAPGVVALWPLLLRRWIRKDTI